ncbi:uncharacterized protein LTR77_002183 [Saxophila tyrrhenica]|uniref:YTH domain-containing protein n=1 Tax=Saxophila tyrrhenica TaxID=1690608 RepID=A0AAV9PKL3_9PEZI|nr:hypothetical protein LTR77_002183 [Saxophila tyrrhenica]
MGDINLDSNQVRGLSPSQGHDQGQAKAFASDPARLPHDSAAFQSQLDCVSQPFPSAPSSNLPYGQRPMDMGALRAALPQLGQDHMGSPSHYGAAGGVGIPPAYRSHQTPPQPMDHRGSMDPRAQQQQYMMPQFSSMPSQGSMMQRQAMPLPSQGQYQQFDPYAYGMQPPPINTFDPRMAPLNAYGMPPQMAGDYGQYIRRGSEPGPIPSYPRGPPRKPKQSGNALWVGNLPPNANVTDLKDHFSKDATKDIESLFLISKSNCAFVNYRTEAACTAAMNRFHDSRFHGVRLVCRLRRGSTSSTTSNQNLAPAQLDTPPPSHHSSVSSSSQTISEEASSPTIVGGSAAPTTDGDTTTSSAEQNQRVPEKFFIVKSLTAQDLEASVRNGIWATQSHNEKALNEAYENADNVCLIFSANKSGEYFGYARMASKISGEPVNLGASVSQAETPSSGAPQSIATPATATAPRGRIIDDSARGTIFWEAEHSDNEDEGSPMKADGESGNQNWGKQFSVEWMSTSRLPFYRTRGLRNPWNANREIKIARDGTELEPSVGRRVVQMFRSPQGPMAPHHPGMYQ